MTQRREGAKGRKEVQRPVPYLLESYATLFQVEFREIEGCILAYVPGAQKPRSEKCSKPIERAIHENTENHQHFMYPIGETAWERWQNNLCLALSVEAFWKTKLQARFPDREFTFVIWNEIVTYAGSEVSDPGIEIMPTLRMWSAANDPDLRMHDSFKVDFASSDLIVVEENWVQSFVSADKVFTRKGDVKKQFLRSLTLD